MSFAAVFLVEQFMCSTEMQYAKVHQIWTFNFLEVVRQHILGVVGNVKHSLVGEFW